MTEAAGRWRVFIDQQPKKVLRKLPRDLRDLANAPRPRGCKRLQSRHELYRVRVGDWRITYAVRNEDLVVVVVELAPRNGASRNL